MRPAAHLDDALEGGRHVGEIGNAAAHNQRAAAAVCRAAARHGQARVHSCRLRSSTGATALRFPAPAGCTELRVFLGFCSLYALNAPRACPPTRTWVGGGRVQQGARVGVRLRGGGPP